MGLSKRAERALLVLKSGGVFRKSLERSYLGGEKFKMRLWDVRDRSVVVGIGAVTFYELEDAGLLKSRPCVVSSVWTSEWVVL